MIQIEQHPTPFAYLLDQPGMVAVLTYEFPVEGTLPKDWFKWAETATGPNYSVVSLSMPMVLPFLTSDAAEEVALHSYHAGAPLMVTAAVAAQRGLDAMYDYADTQNMYGMPGAPDIPEGELRFLGSGL